MRIPLVWSVAAIVIACGDLNERRECAGSTDCPAGEFCAAEGGARFCWPDGVAPAVSGVSARCAADPCVRDGVLRVEATVTDDREVLGATVTLDRGGPSVPMQRAGETWIADVELRSVPFEAFEGEVVATVTAQDGARNEQVVSAPPAGVTRLRWERAVDAVPALDLSAPAVTPEGIVILGGSTARVYFIAADGSDARPSLLVGTGRISAAPAVGERAIWIGSEDFNLYGVRLDGTGVLAGTANTGGAVRGSVAVRTDTTREWAFAASAAGFVGVTSSLGSEYAVAGPANVMAAGPVLGLDGRAYVATSVGNLRAYRLTTTPAVSLTDVWPAPPAVGSSVSAPLAVDATGGIWTGSADRYLYRTEPLESGGTETLVASLPAGIVGSPVVLSNGDVVVADQGGAVHRLTSSGAPVWPSEPKMPVGAEALSPLVLSGGSATLLVPTTAGTIHALREDGSEAWSGTLAPGVSLRAGNIHTPPGPTPITSTAYFSASNGRLYAVVVDGRLDEEAPWPKAFHDPRNTNRAGPQP